MKTQIKALVASFEKDLISFTRDIVRIKSRTCHEGNVVKRIEQEMLHLGYDEVIVDKTGNVIGVMGSGPHKLLLDSHIDNVAVNDPENWSVDPYGGEIIDGKLFGRGSSDMKGSAAASVYAGYAIKQLGLDKGKTIYVCCSVMEEDYDGEGLYRAIVDNNLDPDYVVICEPSHLQISLGHLGRAIYKITAKGISAHGAAPEKGDNAVYKVPAIIERIEALGKKYMALSGEKPSIALTRIESEAVSLNAIPESCSLYIDRRMTLSEDETSIAEEMDMLVKGTGASWEIYDVYGSTWTGEKIVLHSFLPAWEIPLDHKLTKGCIRAYEELMGKEPVMYKWDFSTNGVATAGKLGIPTIGFGAGIEKLAHTTDEYCPVSDIISACEFYTLLPAYL